MIKMCSLVSGIGCVARSCKLLAVTMASSRRRLSGSPSDDNVIVSLDSGTGIATLKLNRGPANCFDLGFSLKLSDKVKQLEADANCRAVIITSNIPGIFSGGLDFAELYKPKRESFLKFIQSYQQLWLDIYSSPLVTIAAINGSSPAGGCVIAIATDYRVMSTLKGTIGLNEVQVGIPIRRWLFEPYARLLGQRQAELAILRSKLFKPDEALAIGLLDEIVSDEAQLIDRAEEAAKSFLKVPDQARRRSKLVCRRDVIENATREREEMLGQFADSILSEEMQATLEKYVQSLKKKKL